MDEESAFAAGALAGGLVALQTAGTLGLWLVNGDGPFDQRRWPGILVALGAGVVVFVATCPLVRALALRNVPALVVGATLLLATMWVLLPSRIDVGESFVPRSNPRWSCTGWTFTTYPVATMDAGSSRWCLGLEHRISDG